MDIFGLMCATGTLVALVGAFLWEKRPEYKRQAKRRIIERGYGFLLENDEYNDAIGSEELLIHRPLQNLMIAKQRHKTKISTEMEIAPNCFGDMPLHLAVVEDDIGLVHMLIDKGADPNEEGRWRQTPLHCAVHERGANLDIVRFLIKSGAEVNLDANWGHTPLHYAVADGRDDIAAFLLKEGADIYAPAIWWREHKYYAGHYDIVTLMLNLDDGPDEMRVYEMTPLKLAINLGHTKIVKLLRG